MSRAAHPTRAACVALDRGPQGGIGPRPQVLVREREQYGRPFHGLGRWAQYGQRLRSQPQPPSGHRPHGVFPALQCPGVVLAALLMRYWFPIATFISAHRITMCRGSSSCSGLSCITDFIINLSSFGRAVRGLIAPAAPAGPERTGPRAGKMQCTAEPRARARTAPPRGRSGAPHHHQARPRAPRPAGAGPPTRTDRPTSSPSGSRPERARGARAARRTPQNKSFERFATRITQQRLVLWVYATRPPTPEPSRGPDRAHGGPRPSHRHQRARRATAGGPRRPGSRIPGRQYAPGQARSRPAGPLGPRGRAGPVVPKGKLASRIFSGL